MSTQRERLLALVEEIIKLCSTDYGENGDWTAVDKILALFESPKGIEAMQQDIPLGDEKAMEEAARLEFACRPTMDGVIKIGLVGSFQGGITAWTAWISATPRLIQDEPAFWHFLRTKLAVKLERLSADVENHHFPPIPMLLRCTKCGNVHIDRDEWATKRHSTHYCEWCRHEWKPCNLATVGVEKLP